jgi:hypothetical protein
MCDTMQVGVPFLTFYVFFDYVGKHSMRKDAFRTYCAVYDEDLLLGTLDEWVVTAAVYCALHSGLRRPYHRHYRVQVGDNGPMYRVGGADLDRVGESCVFNLMPKLTW